jgi:hypothetical protein
VDYSKRQVVSVSDRSRIISMMVELHHLLESVGDDSTPHCKRSSRQYRERSCGYRVGGAQQYTEPVVSQCSASPTHPSSARRSSPPSPAPSSRCCHRSQSDGEANSDQGLSVLSYNVYAGTPINIPGLSRQQYSLLASGRLPAQTREILRLRPSVVCLQEVHSSKVVDEFAKGLSAEYDYYWAAVPWHRLLMTAAFWLLCTLLAPALVFRQGYAISAALLWIFVLVSTRQSCICNFLVGGVDAGLLTMWRRQEFELAGEPSSVHYKLQSGEIEDVFMTFARPRGYLRVPLRRRVVSGGVGADAKNEPAIDFLNTHALLGHDAENSRRRARQVGQVLSDYADEAANGHGSAVILAGDFNAKDCREGLEVLLEHGFLDSYNAAGDPTQSNATWSPVNELTLGYHCEENFTRLDYVLSRDADRAASAANADKAGRSSSNWSLVPTSSKVVLAEPPYLSDHYGVLATYSHRCEEQVVAASRNSSSSSGSTTIQKKHSAEMPLPLAFERIGAMEPSSARRTSLSPPVSPPTSGRRCSSPSTVAARRKDR